MKDAEIIKNACWHFRVTQSGLSEILGRTEVGLSVIKKKGLKLETKLAIAYLVQNYTHETIGDLKNDF